MAYTYPDKGDKLTCQLISEYDGRYWQESEERVLGMALDAVQKLRKSRQDEGIDKIRLLDLGCGMGRLFGVFAPYVDEIIGAEPDAGRCAAAKIAGAAAALKYRKPVKVIHGDAAAVESECAGVNGGSTRFDIVLSSHVLQHIPTWLARALMETMSNLVEPGALLIMTTTYTAGSEDLFFREEWQDKKRLSTAIDMERFNTAYNEEGVLPVRMFSSSTIIEMADGAGLDLITIAQYHYQGHTSAEHDRQANLRGDGEKARDALYIFTRK